MSQFPRSLEGGVTAFVSLKFAFDHRQCQLSITLSQPLYRFATDASIDIIRRCYQRISHLLRVDILSGQKHRSPIPVGQVSICCKRNEQPQIFFGKFASGEWNFLICSHDEEVDGW